MDEYRNTNYAYEHDDYYCYPGSNVLKNKLGITNAELFEQAERKITYLRTMEAMKDQIPGGFDYNHLKKIHLFLFGDIFEWAGKPRTVNISKGTQFCRVEYIDEQIERVFAELSGEKYFKELLSREQVVKRLAYYLGEINAVHPFREGNGRTQRIFIYYLAHTLGYELDFSKVNSKDMILASAKAFNTDYSMMEEILGKIISDK